MKIVLCVVLAIVAIKAEGFDSESDVLTNLGQNDYAMYDYVDNQESGSRSDEFQDEADKQVEADILAALNNSGDEDKFDALGDYQFEDNRSDSAAKESSEDTSKAEPGPDDTFDSPADDLAVIPLEPRVDSQEKQKEEDSLGFDFWGPLPIPENNKESLDEENNNENSSDQSDKDSNVAGEPNIAKESSIEGIIEETNILLNENSDGFKVDADDGNDDDNDEDDYGHFNSDEDDKSFEQLFAQVSEEIPESPAKVLNDLSADLDKLFDTLDKLRADNSDASENNEKGYNDDNEDEIKDYEDKNERPYKEGNILSLRNDYEIFEDSKIEENDVSSNEDKQNSHENENYEQRSKEKSDRSTIVDEDRSDIEKLDYSDEIKKILSRDDNEEEEKVNDIIGRLLRHSYGNDGLVDDHMPINEDAEVFLTTETAQATTTATSVALDSTTGTFTVESDKTTAQDSEKLTTAYDGLSSSEAMFEVAPEAAAIQDQEKSTVLNEVPNSSENRYEILAVSVSPTMQEGSTVVEDLNRSEYRDAIFEESDSFKEQDQESTTVAVDELNSSEYNAILEDPEASNLQDEETSTIKVGDLNSSEYKELMSQFAFAHSEDLDVKSDKFIKDIAPIHITLSHEEPTVITSPGYPQPYPTNNIVDWIIEGPGMGIEMNVTNFRVNGAIGDYLLVKPGGIDESGTDGLVFSFELRTERKYRFLNVNRMFVRFESKPGMQFFNGFSFSVKMIWPPRDILEEQPEPEQVIETPTETLILSLAGVSMPNFHNVKPAFKELIADMAQQYIEDNDIDPGLNTTLEVVQITKVAVCNIRWPNYETCVEVTVVVPLVYEEEVDKPVLSSEQLDTMWSTYIVEEPYASRLSEMGITEYAIPDDGTIFMVWLAVALGVVISMGMLAFALWRFRCFEDYTRMMAYAETDNHLDEKKNLDLYPTPHQTLPPLYTDNDYRWADGKFHDTSRVDMGGFSNKSYVRDELFDFESDEDVITARERYTSNV